MAHILFYGRSLPHFCFSNWFPCRFTCADGKLWTSSEHYYMSRKTFDEGKRELIRLAKTPKLAKAFAGPEGIIELHPDWEKVKFDIMVEAILLKFSQNADIREELLSTTGFDLHENCPDPIWGGGPNYPNSQDLLGKALMKARDILAAS
jgi:ribA/ribD-fused uncharacterized protein